MFSTGARNAEVNLTEEQPRYVKTKATGFMKKREEVHHLGYRIAR